MPKTKRIAGILSVGIPLVLAAYLGANTRAKPDEAIFDTASYLSEASKRRYVTENGSLAEICMPASPESTEYTRCTRFSTTSRVPECHVGSENYRRLIAEFRAEKASGTAKPE